MASTKITKDDFLNAHKLNERVFVTGMFYPGITIYNQQVRTLNLIYYLTQKRITNITNDANERIVIIGGGMSGLTAAIAFKKLGYKIVILEEKSILLHLQHGCTTRQIHPNLFLWPRKEAIKPFTELPFCNWEASNAADIEKSLSKEFENVRKNDIEVVFNIDSEETRINLSKRTVSYKQRDQEEKQIQFNLVLLATGFGLEKYVGREEITKSYWRSEDLGQLRIKDQIKKFFISGVGDGGVSDVFRLSLLGFDIMELIKIFTQIKKGRSSLIGRLRTLEENSRKQQSYNYYSDFNKIYKSFSTELSAAISKFRRTDIEALFLNGKDEVRFIFAKGKLSFINAWILFVLHKQNLFKYHPGNFPENCGGFLFTDKPNNEYHVIVRHGTASDAIEKIKTLNKAFGNKIANIETLQRNHELNEFSVNSKWKLEYWSDRTTQYIAKKYFVSPALDAICSNFLTTLEGLIRNFVRDNINGNFDFRMTLHRLVCYSDEYYFQQICRYVGDRTGGDSGRAFPIDQGIVGLAMRTNTCCSLIRKPNDEGKGLFNYEKLFARHLTAGVRSFFVIPVPCRDKLASVMCLYIDTNEEKLVTNTDFRRLIYWLLTSFIEKIQIKNVEEREVSASISSNPDRDQKSLNRTPELVKYNDEIKPYWKKRKIKMYTNRLIDIYEK